MAKPLSTEAIGQMLDICTSCVGSQGNQFDEKACSTCTEGGLSRLPRLKKEPALPIGAITFTDIACSKRARVIA